VSALAEKDGLTINYLDVDGLKWTTKLGAILNRGDSHPFVDFEGYYYKLWNPHWVLALHTQWRETRSNYAENQFYLGGFSSVRGVADGELYGPRFGYLNAEMRKVVFKSKYLWLQAAAFSDIGYAGTDWDDFGDDYQWGGGVGLRFACPLVNRMVIRVDYGMGLNGKKEAGISAGFNGFFQSHRIHD
jgi:outer membrane protein assembly factor BamA